MNRWKNYIKDLGNITSNEKILVTFKANEKLPKISKIEASCSCISPKYNESNNSISISYKPKKVPVHLQDIGYYTTTKSITINYSNGEYDELKFKARIYDTKPF